MTKLRDIDVPEGLIASARDGVEASRARLYAVLAPAIFGLIRRIVGGRAVAEDLFHDTMITLYEHLGDYRGDGAFGAWVRQIAVSKSLMYLRSPWQRARLELDAAFGDTAFPAPTLTAAGSSAADAIDLERALASLAPTARAVVWLYEVEGYTHEEIAHAFGRTPSFSKSQLSRAYRHLRERLEPHGVRHPCAHV